MKIYIRGQTIDLTQLSRQEIVDLKRQLEEERVDIKNQLLRPAELGPRRMRKAKEAYEIKGKQIHQINEYLRRQ